MARRSLLQKYDIPLSHLDFTYIEKCDNGKAMEKIVHILQSGEEGWYPELTKCAEDKLKELMPDSRFFRKEEKIVTKDDIESSEWLKEGEPIMQWSNEVKLKDNFLSTLANGKTDELLIPPIRHETKKIDIAGFKKEEANSTSSSCEKNKIETSGDNIASTDYKKWDKFDADTAILKMDLDEERNKELTEIMNKKNLEKSKENKDSEFLSKTVLCKLSNVEKETLSAAYKDRGNEFFKAKEYENSVVEYTKSLEVLPSAAGYNNRAVAYLKLVNYSKCIKDCDKCLQIEPNNIKALLRKGQAFLGIDKKRDAYEIYSKIISIEPSNISARNSLNDLKKQLPNLPPSTATRIPIQDANSSMKTIDPKSELIDNNEKDEKKTIEIKIPEDNNNADVKKQIIKKPSSYNYVQEDLSKLIIPKKIVKNKMVAKTLEAMKNNKNLPNKINKLDQFKGNKSIPKTISSEIKIPDGRIQQYTHKCENQRNLIEELK